MKSNNKPAALSAIRALIEQNLNFMEERKKKKKQGGSRQGAGRKKKEGMRKATFNLSSQVLDYLDYYTKGTGYPKNMLVNDVLFSVFSERNRDFEYCPKCGAPVLYLPVINVGGNIHVDCPHCGHEHIVKM